MKTDDGLLPPLLDTTRRDTTFGPTQRLIVDKDNRMVFLNRAALCAFINQERYGVVSSTATNGAPQSALVGIAATVQLEIIFDTVKSSRKYRNLVQRPLCSLVVGWSGEQTLQLEGVAHEPEGKAVKHLQDVYFALWPECREHLSWPGIAYFVIRPTWLRYTDYDQNPALIQEVGKQILECDF